MLSLGPSIVSPAILVPVGLGFVPDADAEAIWNSFTTPASKADKLNINNLVLALKAIPAFNTTLLRLYVHSAGSDQAGRVNWIAPGTDTLSKVNAPTFTAYRGFAGNGSNAVLNSVFAPSVDGGTIYTLNDACMFFWSRSDIDESKGVCGTRVTGSARLHPRQSGSAFYELNGAGFINVANTDGSGFFMVQRRASNDVRLWRNGVQLLSSTSASTALPSSVFKVLSDGLSFCAREASIFGCGAGLVGNELALYNAFLAYQQAVGAA
jgi:hypothetical protein